MKEGVFTSTLKKQGTKMVYIRSGSEQKYKDFVQSLDDGDQVDIMLQVNSADNTLLQLDKVHKCIREIAKHTGNNFDDIKMVVKDKAGLVTKRTVMDKTYMDWKSFGKISKTDLSLAIKAAIELGDVVGLDLSSFDSDHQGPQFPLM